MFFESFSIDGTEIIPPGIKIQWRLERIEMTTTMEIYNIKHLERYEAFRNSSLMIRYPAGSVIRTAGKSIPAIKNRSEKRLVHIRIDIYIYDVIYFE